MRLLLVPAVLFLISQNGNEAEKLFESVGKKLADAKGLAIGVDAVMEAGKHGNKLNGMFRFGKGNQNNSEISAESAGQPNTMKMSMKVVSNGTKMKLTSSFIKGAQVKDTPEDFNATLLGGIQRAGVYMSTMPVSSDGKKKTDPAERFKVSDFSLGKKEKVGDHEAQVLKYKLKMEGEPKIINVDLWVDTATHVPLKRVLSGKSNNGDSVKITETYRIMLNRKAEPDLFKVEE